MQNLINPPALIAQALAETAADDRSTLADDRALILESMLAANARQHGVWRGLAHRGQPPARGITGTEPAALVGSKGMSRRDRHRQIVAGKAPDR